MNVMVIGASNKPERYSYMAVERLLIAGHNVFPVHPKLVDVLGLSVYKSASEVKEPIHTVTLYVNAETSSRMAEEILALNPKRILFNPGAENQALFKAAQDKGIEVKEACTLVMLSTGQF